MKGRGWIALAVMVLLVFVLVLLRGTGTQGRSPDHASTSDAADGTSALRATTVAGVTSSPCSRARRTIFTAGSSPTTC